MSATELYRIRQKLYPKRQNSTFYITKIYASEIFYTKYVQWSSFVLTRFLTPKQAVGESPVLLGRLG